MGLASLEKKEVVGAEEVRLIKDVALSSCPDFVRTTVKCLYDAGTSILTSREIEERTKIPLLSLKYILDDLLLLNLVKRFGTTVKCHYSLSERSINLIKESEIYIQPKKVVQVRL
jgi:hypothetical protein